MRAVIKLLPIALLVGLASLSSCSSSRSAEALGVPTGTVAGVGRIPGPLTSQPEIELAPPESIVPFVEISAPISVDQQVGASAAGNRLLMIGDSIFASISRRYGNEACSVLVPRGWQVEVDAETGRAIDFGLQVVNNRLDGGWDAAVIFLGNNYDSSNSSGYRSTLHKILEKLEPRPVALLTTMLFRSTQTEVNEIIRSEAALFPNVVVVEWADVTEPSFTGNDNLHLTPEGRAALAAALAAALGQAPSGDGKCLSTSYTDDSAGSPSGPSGNTGGTKTKSTTPKSPTTTKPSSGTATTVATRPTTPTASTLPRSTPTTTGNGTQPTVTNPPATTPPVTRPPTTNPPVTNPPQTNPPVTSPPQTNAPQTNPPQTNPPPQGTNP